ncbi:DUF4839 domain-containing protein [Actinomycetes bacterium M1A6_2h]
MTQDAATTYDTKTIRAVRGMESRTIKKWEDDGWEVVSQAPGRVQTEITFRRPAPKSRRLLWLVGGGVLTLALVTIFTIGAISEKDTGPTETASPASSEAAAPSEQPSLEPTDAAPPSPPEPADVVLTPENSPELASLLALTDYCSPDIAAFAAAHRGQTISFPGNVSEIAPYEDASTRYLILIYGGDYETSALGPAFQFRDVNTTSDFNWVGSVPDTIGIGTNLNVTAEVDRYIENQCLFLLDPVATAVR